MSDIKIYFKPTGDYKEHRYYEQPDAYGQHSGQITDGYFRASDLKTEGEREYAGFTPVFKDRLDAECYADTAICD